MRTPLAVALLALVAVPSLSLPASSDHLPVGDAPDGVTAKIQSQYGYAHEVWRTSPTGQYDALVTIYTNGTSGWQRTAMNATLRVFVADAETQSWVDTVSIPFRSNVNGLTHVVFDASLVHGGQPGPRMVDIFVTFSELGGDPVPTSHLNIVRNSLIDRGQFALADEMDYFGTQWPIALGA